MTATAPRLPFLDSARGLAALSVITWHCFTAIFNHPENSRLYTSPFHVLLYGEADMIFFFIHSGFILSYAHSEFKNKIAFTTYSRYIAARIFRIYPLFLFILFLSYFLKTTVYPVEPTHLSNHFARFWRNSTSLGDVFRQGILAVRIPDNPYLRLIPQDWTLTVEVLICPLIPFINLLNGKFKLFSWLVVLILLKLFHFNTYLFEFTIGVNLYYYRNYISAIWAKCPLFAKYLAFVLATVLYSCCFGYPNIFSSEKYIFSPAIDRLLVVSGCSLFFIFILNSIRIQNFLAIPALTKIGKICYSLYVNHILLLILFSNIVISELDARIKNPEWLVVLLFVVFFQVLNILVSFASHYLIERPFNRLGKSITAYLERG